MRILIADDEPVSRLVVSASTKALGHQATLAEDGAEAWLRFAEDSPDVVICDWDMPGMNGTELIRRVRQATGRPYTYLIMLSGQADEATARATMLAGADDVIGKPLDPAELERKLIGAERVLGLHARLANEARDDVLTGLGNRRRLDEDLATHIARAKRYGHRFALAIIDVDRFKRFNDLAGHLAGDGALRHVADVLRTTLRGGDSLYRYGGEEFAVLLPEQTAETALLAAERLRAQVEALAHPHPDGGVLTISVGVAVAGSRYVDPVELFARADSALYRAKSDGRNRVALHAPPVLG